jgi:two-component system heavy metal sensor histidine kinase CusS
MSSKLAERAPSPLRTWSITTRLTILIAGTGFMILFASGCVLYWTVQTSLDAEIAQFLADKVFVLRAIAQDRPDDHAALDEEARLEGAARRYNRYYVRILDPAGRTLIETPGMNDLLPPAAFARRQASLSGLEKHPEINLSSGSTIAVSTAEAPTRDGGHWLVQIALDVSNKSQLLASFRRNFAAVLVLGLLVSALAGRAIARRGLAPLTAITRSARAVNAANLAQRMGSSEWPRELEDLAAAFDQMLARLEDSFRRLSQFSADIAHELRTPMTSFLTQAQVILSRPRTLDEYRQALESGIEDLGALARMVDSLLFLARADQASMPIERESLDLRQTIANVVEFHRNEADERQIALDCEGDATILANAGMLQRAVNNLLSNALRHTPSQGRVGVRIAQGESGSATISVSDTGCGIAAEHLPHLFDRFYRADQSRAHHTGGVGLGLALVRSIMALHGGEADIESAVGKGTTVRLRFIATAASTS